jgi:hypothetical protein
MPKAIMFVQTSPADPTREAEYNDWYDNIHCAEVCDIPGIVSAKRFKLSDANQGLPEGTHGYAAIYEVEADDLVEVSKELGRRAGDGRMQMNTSLGRDPEPVVLWYEVL